MVGAVSVAVPIIDPTPIDTYTVIYCPGEYGSGAQQSFIGLSSFHTVKGALFTRQDYTQTAWVSEDGATTNAFGANIILSAKTTKFYPVWTEDAGDKPVAVFNSAAKTLSFYCDRINHANEGVCYSVSAAGELSPSTDPDWVGSCKSVVTQVVFDASFVNYRPKHCGSWFWNFSYLAAVEGMEYLDVSGAASLAYMFGHCSKLATLDLSKFNTSNVTSMSSMFSSCTSLKTIYASDDFVVDNVTSSSSMFADCTSLIGGKGTAYDANHKDCLYARIDLGSGGPGYFTAKNSGSIVKITKPTKVQNLIYTGSSQQGYLNCDARLTVSGTGSATAAGNYSVTFTLPAATATETFTWADDNTTGAFTIKWSIALRDLSDTSVVFASIPDQKYTGAAITPAVTMTFAKSVCTLGTDYTVAYLDNVEPGAAQAKVTGVGNFTGTRSLQFMIVKASEPDPSDYTLSQALNSGMSFTTGGSASWFAQTSTSYDGVAAQSGAIGNSASTYMETTVSGPGTLSFYWKVSSESLNHDCLYDYLEVAVDGSSSGKIGGTDGGWELKSITLTGSGTHTIRWTYRKDGSVSSGSDCGWVDCVRWQAEGCYTVSFEANGGSGEMSDCSWEAGKVYNLPKNQFTRSGKRFAGWKCSNGRRYDDGMLVFDLAEPGEIVTMTAIWE